MCVILRWLCYKKKGDNNYSNLFRSFCCKENDGNNVVAFFYGGGGGGGGVKKAMTISYHLFLFLFVLLM